MVVVDVVEVVFKGLWNFVFIKFLLYLYIVGGFWMGFFFFFCKEYLLIEDECLMLEVNNMEWECVYFVYKGGLSGGW